MKIKKNKDKDKFWYTDDLGRNVINKNGEFDLDTISIRQEEADYKEWQSIVRYALNQNYPMDIFAAPFLSASELKLVIDVMWEDEKYIVPSSIAKPKNYQIYRLTRSGLSYNQLWIALICLKYGLDLVEELSELRRYDEEKLWLVLFAHVSANTNFCKLLEKNKNISTDELKSKVLAQYKKRGKKEKLSKAIMQFTKVII